MNSIIISAGCFWGVQAYFKLVKGVTFTYVGYIQGSKQFPIYEEVVSGQTGHVEACLIKYDSTKTNLSIILEHLFSIIEDNKEIENRFRNGIYYCREMDKGEIFDFIEYKNLNSKSNKKRIFIEVQEAKEFWEAEEYHQNFLEKNFNSFCHLSKEKFILYRKIDESYQNYLNR